MVERPSAVRTSALKAVPAATARKAYSYLRFSTLEQRQGDSMRRQTAMALDYAHRHGLDLDSELTFQDLGVSAFRGRNAETGMLAYFLEAVDSGLVQRGSYLLVEGLDRLSRLTPRKALRVLEDIVERGITVVTLNDGKAYTSENLDSDQMSLMWAILIFMRANEESATKARRLKAAWEGKRQSAMSRPLTASVPAWMRLNQDSSRLELVEARVEVVRRVFREYLSGKGHHAIAAGLNGDSIECWGLGARKASMWHRTYVRKILTNPATYGDFVPHTEGYEAGRLVRTPLAPIVGYYPAVVSREDFDEVQAMHETAVRSATKGVGAAHLLAGLCLCPSCGKTMTRVYKGVGGGKPKLVCTRAKAGAGCQYVGVDVTQVEDAVCRGAERLGAEAPGADEELDARLERETNNLDALDDAIGNLVSAVEGGMMSPAVRQRLADLEHLRDETRQARDDLLDRILDASDAVVTKRLEGLERALTAVPLDRGRANAALRTLVTAIVVDYFSGELTFRWKHGGESSLRFAWPREDLKVA